MNDQRTNRLSTLAYVLIALGAVLLVSRLGWFDFSGLLGVLQFWPVLVIAAGVDLLTQGKHRALVYGGGVAAVLVLSLTGVGTGLGGFGGGSASAVRVEQELLGARSVDVYIATSVAEFDLTGDSQAQLLASGSLGQHAREQVDVDYTVRGSRGEFRAASQGISTTNFFALRNAVPWDLTLTGRVPLALRVETGMGESSLDLRELQLESLSIKSGIGSTTVQLPRSGFFPASIDGGIGEINVRVPRDLAVRIVVDTGIGSVDIPNNFTRTGDVITSPNYSPSAPAVELKMNAGIGSIHIQSVD